MKIISTTERIDRALQGLNRKQAQELLEQLRDRLQPPRT